MSSPYLNERPYTARVRSLNDRFRKTFEGGRVVATRGIAGLATGFQNLVIEAVQSFDAFDEANDPWHEHDFGKLCVEGRAIFWKIDYFDLTLGAPSPNPAKPELTTRILTIMLAEEY